MNLNHFNWYSLWPQDLYLDLRAAAPAMPSSDRYRPSMLQTLHWGFNFLSIHLKSSIRSHLPLTHRTLTEISLIWYVYIIIPVERKGGVWRRRRLSGRHKPARDNTDLLTHARCWRAWTQGCHQAYQLRLRKMWWERAYFFRCVI